MRSIWVVEQIRRPKGCCVPDAPPNKERIRKDMLFCFSYRFSTVQSASLTSASWSGTFARKIILNVFTASTDGPPNKKDTLMPVTHKEMSSGHLLCTAGMIKYCSRI